MVTYVRRVLPLWVREPSTPSRFSSTVDLHGRHKGVVDPSFRKELPLNPPNRDSHDTCYMLTTPDELTSGDKEGDTIFDQGFFSIVVEPEKDPETRLTGLNSCT